MAYHAMLKTWPSGLSHDKNLGLRPQFLSTWVPRAMIKTYNTPTPTSLGGGINNYCSKILVKRLQQGLLVTGIIYESQQDTSFF